MDVFYGYLDAMLAALQRDARIFFTYRLRWVSRVASSLLTVTVFFYVAKLVRPDAVGKHASYFSFLIVGMVAVPVLESALTLAQLVRMELVAGNFERMLVSPMGPVAGMISMALFPMIYAVVLSALTLGIGVALYDVPIHAAGVPAALVVAGLGAAAFAGIGILFVGALIAYKTAAGATWVMAGLGLVGGVYFPAKLFPGWISWASDVQPLSPAVDLLRHFLVGTPAAHPVTVEFIKLGGFAAFLVPVACAVLWQALKVSRRRGTIMEY